jgi:diguanylate cyclase (GGDEF)-like protein
MQPYVQPRGQFVVVVWQDAFVNLDLRTRITSSPQLPTLPAIAMQVLDLTRRDDLSVQDIASLIMNDPALASKILKTVNSPFYGLPKQVSTVSNAIVILGLQAVKTLALGFSLLANLQKKDDRSPNAFDHTLFWKRSIYAAVGSRVLARKMSVIQQEEAFLAGLLSGIGVLVLHRVLGESFDQLHIQAAGDYDTLVELSRQHLDVEPPEVSALLAEKWQFPPLLARPIALHYKRGESDPRIRPLVDVVSAGVMISDVFTAQNPAAAIAKVRRELATLFNLQPADIETLLDQIGKSAREAASLLEMQIGKERPYQEILNEAQEALVSLSLQSQQQVQSIKREVQTLQVKATTDPLTGIANRARFDDFFHEQFARAVNHQRPLALLFLDIDHFKKINDTFGHQAGDEVLRRVAKILRNATRNIDLVARYGGEEFALVLTETDTNAAAGRAEIIRSAIAAEPVRFHDQLIRMTASVGVAGTDRSRVFSERAQLTNAADRAVYAAKCAGRNTVRVFRPRIETVGTHGPAAART